MITTLRPILRIFLFAMLCISLIGIDQPVFAHSTPDDFSEVDAYITETMHRLPIKGLSLAIVKGGQILYLQGYGTANTQGDPVTPQTPFMMGSVTKSFTALAARQLAAAGKLNLYAPVQTYLPEFRLADPHATSLLTVRHLLDHRSGISTLAGQANYLYSSKTTFDEVLTQVAHYQPTYPPGAHYEYSNLNYVLLARVIARASGQPYPDYVQKNILDPLEMSHASFADYHTQPQAATGNQIFFGIRAPFDEPYEPAMFGAGGLSASAEDMAHYLILFFNHGQYRGRNLLPATQAGWYDPSWNWHAGSPNDGPYSHSGGPDSLQTNIQFVTANQDTVCVTLLMNTRLDTILPAPQAYQIAFNVAHITMGLPYELLSNRGLYTSWALFDSFLLLLAASMIWQALKAKNWRNQYHAAPSLKRIVAWLVIIFDLLICVGIVVLPSFANTRWDILLAHRPDFAVPLLVVALCLGAIGLMKVLWSIRYSSRISSRESSGLESEPKGA
jgi:CubicO group peptidase (beta-lactamase class C family)